MLHHGVVARGPGQKDRVIRLDKVQEHGYLQFHDVQAFLKKGKPVMGGFTCNRLLKKLKRGAIYRFSPSKRIPTYEHMVVFVGYGWRKGEPYLVFLNSDSEGFSQDGFGRIWFDEVREFHTIQVEGQPFQVDPILTHGPTESYTGRHGVSSATTGSASASRSYGASSSSRTPCHDGDQGRSQKRLKPGANTSLVVLLS
jgi:hypothetical protein